MPSPVRHTTHARPHGLILAWLGAYHAATPGTDLGDNATVILDLENEVQPDALLRLHGGQSTVDQEGYIRGAPELIVEIAASSASYDLHEKLAVYRCNQVQEYLVWRVYDRQIDWFALEEGDYTTLQPAADSVSRSHVFPGLWLDMAAMLAQDLSAALETLQTGIQHEAHSRFLAELEAGPRPEGKSADE